MVSSEVRFPQVRAVELRGEVAPGLAESGVVGTWLGTGSPDLLPYRRGLSGKLLASHCLNVRRKSIFLRASALTGICSQSDLSSP